MVQRMRRVVQPVHRMYGSPRRPAARAALAWLLWLVALEPAAALVPFQFDKPQELAKPVWTRTVQAGVGQASGNVSSTRVTAEALVGRRTRRERFQLGGSLAFARTRVLVGRDENGVPGIGWGELHPQSQVTRQAWALRGRWDLYATPQSSGYLSLAGEGDRPAGKGRVLSAQLGYGTDLAIRGQQLLRLEAGYDFSSEEPVIGRLLRIHSARLFLGYRAAVEDRLTFTLDAELLTNLNQEPPNPGPVRRFEDTRATVRATAAHKLGSVLSLQLRFTATYDRAPPVRPPPLGLVYEPGYTPPADRLDSVTDLVLAATF